MACAKPGFSPGRSSQLTFPLVARMSWRGLPLKGGSALHVMLFLENLIRALLIFNEL
jgi:hypothetical protein